MIVCSCNVLSSGAIRSCLNPGPGCPRTPAQVYECLGCSAQCGRCARTIRSIMDKALAEAHNTCRASCGTACPLSHEVATSASTHIGNPQSAEAL